MHVSWLGLSAFKIESKDAVIVTDPYGPSVFARPLKATADIVTMSKPSSDAHGRAAGVHGNPFVIDTPGEFEVKGTYIHGISLARDGGNQGGAESRTAAGSPAFVSTLFTFDVEGIRLVHTGDIREAPTDDILEKLGDVDVLFLPVGGGPTLDPEAAMRVVNEVEPRIVIPMYYQQPGLTLPSTLLPVGAFLREIGASKVEPVERLNLKKRDLVSEETNVVLFRG